MYALTRGYLRYFQISAHALLYSTIAQFCNFCGIFFEKIAFFKEKRPENVYFTSIYTAKVEILSSLLGWIDKTDMKV
ncbi:hypothetical protein Sgly_1401 [Syntrophobotulus glycolicus DSM 8271]|uniref:Uncharacterized protein n=1 Tax=Syntrophobotulus glycolicus (strain DSM 8271 / FlGlyR) TaxID=645991 RepID=F0SWD8_SYNGF|nr:hypothetical protein Sgly_1401 [Syntrophobotulus glycolicus DSM 8271]